MDALYRILYQYRGCLHTTVRVLQRILSRQAGGLPDQQKVVSAPNPGMFSEHAGANQRFASLFLLHCAGGTPAKFVFSSIHRHIYHLSVGIVDDRASGICDLSAKWYDKVRPALPKAGSLLRAILLFLFSIPYAATAYVVRFELVEYSAGLIFILVLCWELYILTGLIPVNTQYSEVFRRSTVAMQILSPTGERIAVSENAADITPAMLEALKQNQHFSATEDITMNLHQIPGGYMVWQTDLSQINQALRELQRLNAEYSAI